MAKRIDMGTAGAAEVRGCAVFVDGEEVDEWSGKDGLARAGYRVWKLSAEQVAALSANPAASFTRKDYWSRGFHK